MLNNFYTNFCLIKLISSNYVNLQFFYAYESFLLQKFVDSKNLYLDNLNYVKYLSRLNNLNNNAYIDSKFFFNYKISIDLNRDAGQGSGLVKYNAAYGVILSDLDVTLRLEHLLFLKNFLFFIFMLNALNLYKLSSILAIYNK
jgi:hypothetical protein